MLTVMRIDRWDSRRDGPVTEAALRHKVDAIGYQVSKCVWAAGTVVPPETPDDERVDALVSGIVKITIDGETAILTAGDIVYVPRGAVRKVEVIGVSTAHCLRAAFSDRAPALGPRRIAGRPEPLKIAANAHVHTTVGW